MQSAEIVLNYPDGNEGEIAKHLMDSSAELWLITAELGVRSEWLDVKARHRIERPGPAGIAWQLSVFTDPRTAGTRAERRPLSV